MKIRKFKRKNIIKNKNTDFEVLFSEVADDDMTFEERVTKFEECSKDPVQQEKIFTELEFTDLT